MSNESDERFEEIGRVLSFIDSGNALKLLASIQAEHDRYREALEEIADIEGDLNAMGSPSANILAGIAAAALSGEEERP